MSKLFSSTPCLSATPDVIACYFMHFALAVELKRSSSLASSPLILYMRCKTVLCPSTSDDMSLPIISQSRVHLRSNPILLHLTKHRPDTGHRALLPPTLQPVPWHTIARVITTLELEAARSPPPARRLSTLLCREQVDRRVVCV